MISTKQSQKFNRTLRKAQGKKNQSYLIYLMSSFFVVVKNEKLNEEHERFSTDEKDFHSNLLVPDERRSYLTNIFRHVENN